MGKANAYWHRANRLSKSASRGERVRWHFDHSRNCACRKAPARISVNLLTAQAMLASLRGGDRRMIGQSEKVAAVIMGNPELFGVLLEGMNAGDAIVSMRSADAAEKVSARHPEWLSEYRQVLLRAARSKQQEVRWHVAQMVPRVDWTTEEKQWVLSILQEYLKDPSSIVRTFAMQALADLAAKDPKLRPGVLRQVRGLTRTGTPAMKARGRKLLSALRSR